MASPHLRQSFLSPPPPRYPPPSPCNFKSHPSNSSKKDDAQTSHKKDPPKNPQDPAKSALARALEYKQNIASATAHAITIAPIEQLPTQPQVEILVGDTSKFGYVNTPPTSPTDDQTPDLYKPKVSTWGVFPRPENISKTYGGGRNINPGDALETEEQRAAKDNRTRAAIAAYKKKVGLILDPLLTSECQTTLDFGNSLMDSGKLRDAIGNYEYVMDKLPFQNELHGIAALQWSICKDSLSRGDEARAMYEKLQSHPNGQVRKKANHFVYSFQAMSMMKVADKDIANEPTYQKFFDAFVEDKMVYADDSQGNSLRETVPYLILLLSPVVFVLLLSVRR